MFLNSTKFCKNLFEPNLIQVVRGVADTTLNAKNVSDLVVINNSKRLPKSDNKMLIA